MKRIERKEIGYEYYKDLKAKLIAQIRVKRYY